MNAQKLLLTLIVLLAAGLSVTFLLNSGAPDQAPTPVLESDPTPSEEPPTSEPIQAAPREREQVEESEPERVAVPAIDSSADAAQGARGTILDPNGTPLEGVSVYLMEGTGGNIFRHMQLQQQGAVIPPIAQASTDAQGKFALGVDRTDASRVFEIRVVTDDFVDHAIPNLRIATGQWYDAGMIRLERGAAVFGRVTIKGSPGLPVTDAIISLKAVNAFPSLTPTPGREDGISARVDHTGSYRIEHAPEGMVTVSAVATNFARIQKTNIQVDKAAQNQVDFELPPGVSIAGVVLDNEGGPVAGARLTALAMSNKQPVPTNATSNQDGTFELIGLLNGAYMISTTASGFVKNDMKPVQAGEGNLRVVLDKQGSARLKVYDKAGRLLTSAYQVAVKQYFESHQQFGNNVIQPRSARPSRDGIFEVGGLNPGSYAFQVVADGHAKAFSDPFTIASGQEAPLLEVRLNTGGEIAGTVVDFRGNPLPGVVVKTLPNGFEKNAFTQILSGMMPFTITRTQTTTNAKGEYQIAMLNEGAYQLEFSHPDNYEVAIKDQQVEVGKTLQVARIQMLPGTVVTGVARVDGQPASQVKVTLTSVPDPTGKQTSMFNAEAVTDNDGNFQLSARVPPGRYQVMAARQTLPSPINAIADYHKTKQEFTLGQGQLTYQVQINIPSQ